MKPYRLAEKLAAIRKQLGLSQNQILFQLTAGDEQIAEFISRKNISHYELGRLEPPLPVLLRYARIASVSVDVLIDDELELPKRPPGTPKRTAKKQP
ncbi:MAG TPA: helix-turn-helix transcriptional regulator [Blastocatellia bacterium]|nr:helix-turn-helix transcriptional regulator [Blastocatellia bacterium]